MVRNLWAAKRIHLSNRIKVHTESTEINTYQQDFANYGDKKLGWEAENRNTKQILWHFMGWVDGVQQQLQR